MMKLPVLSAAETASWEAQLVGAFDRGEYGVEVVRRCVDIVELLAVAAAGHGRAALIAAQLRRLDADAVERLIASAVTPIGVVARDDTAAEQRLRAMGIAYLVPDDAEPAVVASVIMAAVAAAGAEPASQPMRMFGDPSVSLAIPPGEPRRAAVSTPDRHGVVVACWGPAGAPGRTTTAVTLADEFARSGADSLLVDADVYGGTIAAVLGLLDESPGLAAACRQAGTNRLDAAALAALCWQVSPHLRVLTGIPLAQRWTELRPTGVAAVLGTARELADFTVVDCGFSIEADEELSFDTLAPRRNGATLTVLDAADVIVVVGAGDPIGMQRLVRALGDLRDAEVAAPIWVVLNKVRRVVVPGDPARELTAALERFAGSSPAALLPFDQDSLDAALATGRTLGEMRPTSPLRRAICDLAVALAGTRTATGAGAHRG